MINSLNALFNTKTHAYCLFYTNGTWYHCFNIHSSSQFQVSRLHSRNNSLNPSRAPSRNLSRTASPSPVSAAAAVSSTTQQPPTDDATLPLVLCNLLQREFSGPKSPRHGRKAKKGEEEDHSNLMEDEGQSIGGGHKSAQFSSLPLCFISSSTAQPFKLHLDF